MTLRNAFAAITLLLAAQGWAQEPLPVQPTAPSGQSSPDLAPGIRSMDDGQPLFRLATEQGMTKAIHYRDLRSAAHIDFKGTELRPDACGSARIKNRGGATEIKARFEKLPDPSQIGAGCLTYVLWSVSPEGHAANLGEVLLKNGKGDLRVTESLQAFGLMVTAEPYFAVTVPSDAVVLENVIRKDMSNRMEASDTKVDLVKRAQYAPSGDQASAQDPKAPLVIQEARNALRIARGVGASAHATEAVAGAEDLLRQVDEGKFSRRERIMLARQAVQRAEDARMIATNRQEDLRQARIKQRDEEEKARVARLEAEEKARIAKMEAFSAKADRDAALNQADRTAKVNEHLRTQLMNQLNAVLETRASARGLIVNMSGGVTFKVGKSELSPVAREKLAKIAGILLANRGLKVETEGYTDSTGNQAINQSLSEKRAEAVRAFLIRQGVAKEAIVARGLGMENPVAPNETVEGRLANRRVELIVSGEGLTGSN